MISDRERAFPRRSRESLLAAAGVALLVLAILLPMSTMIPGRDAGVFMYIGQGILQGEVPYRDAWDHKPPLIYFTFAAGLLLSAGKTWGPWLLELLAVSLAGWFSYRLLRPLHGVLVATVVTALWLLVLVDLNGPGGMTETFTLPLQFGAWLLLLRWKKAPGVLRWPLFLGVLAGFAFLYRQNHLSVFVAVFVVGTFSGGIGRGAGDLLRNTAGVVLGGLLVCVPFAGYFLAHDAWGEMWDAAFVYNFNYVSVSLARRIDSMGYGIERIPWSYAALVVWLVVAVRGITRLGLPEGGRGALLLAAWLALPLEFYVCTASGKHYPHYFILLLPAMVVLLGEFFAYPLRWGAARPRHALLARFVLAFLLVAALATLRLGDLRERYMRWSDPSEGLKYRESARFIQAHSQPHERALVWGSEALLLAIAERRSVSRFVGQYPLITRGYATDEMAREFVDAVREDPPAVVVDTGHGFFPSLDPERRAEVEFLQLHEASLYTAPSPLLQSFFEQLDRDYLVVEHFEPFELYLPRGSISDTEAPRP